MKNGARRLMAIVSVEDLDGGVQQRSTCGDTRGVDDAVNPAITGHGRAHSRGRVERIGKINRMEPDVGSVAGQLSGKRLTCCRIAPCDHDPGRPLRDSHSGDAGAEPSSSPADQDDLAIEELAHGDPVRTM
jgi:hypothetical protein